METDRVCEEISEGVPPGRTREGRDGPPATMDDGWSWLVGRSVAGQAA